MISKTCLKYMQSSAFWIALLVLAPRIADAEVAGHVQFVAGDVRIVDVGGKERVAQKGQEINEGETVLTATASSAQLKMIDGGILALRPGTQLKVDNYVFKGVEDGSENALLSLVKGGLRTITGLIGRQNKEKLKLRTPTATIGIRGTDHEPIVVVDPGPGAAPINPPGTYDKVNVGATSLTTNAGTAVIGPNQVGFAASLNQSPVLLPKLPDFYRATPTPLAKGEQKSQGQAGAASQTTAQSSSESTAASSATTSSSDTKTEPASVVATVPVSELTGVNASGNSINLANQTLTTSSGQVVALNSNSSSNTGSGGSSSGSGSTGGTGTTGQTVLGNLLLVSFPLIEADGAVPASFSVGGPGLNLPRDASGNLTGASVSGSASANDSSGSFDLSGTNSSLTQSGSTLTNLGSDTATGLTWGRWQGGTVTVAYQDLSTGAQSTNPYNLGQGSLHWITGPNATPYYLSQILTGSANYTLIGGTNPTDQNGNVGTLNSASLAVNFSTQMVNANVNFAVAGNSWGLQSGPMQLNGAEFQSEQAGCADVTCTGSVVVTKNGVVTSNVSSISSASTSFSYGSISGFLTGTGLNGAALQYSVEDIPTSSGASSITAVQGVAAFSGPTQNVSTPFRAVAIDDGWNNISNIVANNNNSSSNSSFNFGPSYRGSISSGQQPVSSVVDSSAGLTSFVGQASGYASANSSVTPPAAGTSGPLNTINIGTAVNTDLGSASIGGVTVSWGRWAGGTVNIYSADGSTLLGTIDNSNRSIHWLTTSTITNATFNLPTSGTATYTLAGNTAPTDYKGNTGTLNSVTLNADFGNAKVDTTINVSFNAANNTSSWTLTANNMALGGSNGSGFLSDSAQNGINGVTNTITCTGASCSTANHDYVQGHFIAGGQGAGILYGMSTGTVATSTGSNGATISTFTPTNGATGLIVMSSPATSATSISAFTPTNGSGLISMRR